MFPCTLDKASLSNTFALFMGLTRVSQGHNLDLQYKRYSAMVKGTRQRVIVPQEKLLLCAIMPKGLLSKVILQPLVVTPEGGVRFHNKTAFESLISEKDLTSNYPLYARIHETLFDNYLFLFIYLFIYLSNL